MKKLEPWTAPGNDYRGISATDPSEPLSVAIVASGVRDPESLIEAVRAQTYPGPVHLYVLGKRPIDDPSVTCVSGQRELAASTEGHEIVALLGPGELPDPTWLEAHIQWHRRASNLVVLGASDHGRHSEIRRGTRLFLGNDHGFAAYHRSNASLPRAAWLACPDLDVLAGWTLWNSGCFFVYEETATTHVDNPERTGLGDPVLLADVIPHRRFRANPSSIYGTPKVSWLAMVENEDEATAAWDICRASEFADMELVVCGPQAALGRFEALAENNQRVSVARDGFAAAVQTARGELVAVFDPRVQVPVNMITKVVSRFSEKPSATVIRASYRIDGDRYLRIDDLESVDNALGRNGLPLFAVVTRRELMKDQPLLEVDSGAAWAGALERAAQSLVISPTVDFAQPTEVQPRMPRIGDIRSAGMREVTRAVVKETRRRRGEEETDPASEPRTTEERVSVAYVGFTGHDNLGDEAVKAAIERLMPWARFSADAVDPAVLMVGGGTLVNGRRYYLNRMLRQESAVVERVLFGTGVRSPEYWGVTEPMEDWFSFIDSSVFAAVRGPDSVKHLRTMGYRRDLPIIGDPALSLEPPGDAKRVEGRLVVCPVFTDGNLHGGNDDEVFDALATLIARMRSEGRDVVMLSAFPQDDRWTIDIMRRAKAPDMPYLAGYDDIDETMRLLASADLVVGERLHAAIMAAAAGTPFVGLEYRPKMRDFARSIDQESAIIRTDEMHRLGSLCDEVLLHRDEISRSIDAAVARFRQLQKSAASELQARFAPEDGL